ncbi:hypothetical protein GGR21_001981 [Dysgonomonas hofstadii]|uniref:Outer membrane protein beta-barrel domain-containing protein n=1 Tax=Dysgonomonas hofstadii TaxID=637886 RepID=A0A840CJE5_9BACT|nr:porin family protein [Dysgonomonas hofstadii]MBB4036080.1 hypothetical protein [Dysgonomonas hofstadii]
MRTITTSIIFLFLLLMGGKSFAQGLPFSMTANAGINVSDMDIQHLGTNVKVGYNFNVTLEYNLPKKFFLQTGLEFSSKGAKVKDKESGTMLGKEVLEYFDNSDIDPDKRYYYATEIRGKYNTRYFTIPVMGGYRLAVADKIRMNLSIGPYFSYGVGGNSSLSQVIALATSLEGGVILDDPVNRHLMSISTAGKSFDMFKRFDMGLKGNVGIEYYRCLLNIGYEYGFIDQFKADGISSYNMNMFVTVGFRLF